MTLFAVSTDCFSLIFLFTNDLFKGSSNQISISTMPFNLHVSLLISSLRFCFSNCATVPKKGTCSLCCFPLYSKAKSISGRNISNSRLWLASFFSQSGLSFLRIFSLEYCSFTISYNLFSPILLLGNKF